MKKEKKEAENTEKQNVTVDSEVKNVQETSAEQPKKEETEEQEAEQIKAELADLSAKCADLTDKNLRLMAEFDNYRKRTLKEKSDLIKSAGEGVFVEMLPLVDDFERARTAMAVSDDVNAIREGIDLIYNKFIAFLNKNGVKAIVTENADFDVEYHEAITTFPAPTEAQKGKIIDCTSKGYMLGEKVIRFAKVVVGE